MIHLFQLRLTYRPFKRPIYQNYKPSLFVEASSMKNRAGFILHSNLNSSIVLKLNFDLFHTNFFAIFRKLVGKTFSIHFLLISVVFNSKRKSKFRYMRLTLRFTPRNTQAIIIDNQLISEE